MSAGMIYRNNTKQTLDGRARFESILKTDSFSHPRLSWRALQILILYRELREYIPSGAGRSDKLYKYNLSAVWHWQLARAQGLERAYAVARGRWLGRAAAAIARELSKSLVSGAQALRDTHAMQCKNGEQCM
eukprot:3454187-Pleurochrysis_carterae.AAC.1